MEAVTGDVHVLGARGRIEGGQTILDPRALFDRQPASVIRLK